MLGPTAPVVPGSVAGGILRGAATPRAEPVTDEFGAYETHHYRVP